MKKYDVVVLGGGPGGYVAAIRAAQLGKCVALAEKENIGGTCLNTGCIPTKTLVKNAEILKEVRNSIYRGIHINDISINIKETINMKNTVVAQLRQGVEGLLTANGVDFYKGLATVIDETCISIKNEEDTETIEFENLIIATGSRPVEINIKGAGENTVTSDELLNMKEIPESIVIIGGGVIGCEFANILNSFGSKVIVAEAMPRLIANADEEMSAALENSMKVDGIKVKKSCIVKEVANDGSKKKVILLNKSGKEENLYADVVMLSIGRTPNTEGIAALNLEMNGKYIKADEHMKTSIDNIYAIGDVTGIKMLAHAASHMGKVAAENISGIDSRYNDEAVPNCIFTSPELAFTGLTEGQAAEKYGEINVGRFPLAASGKALTMGETDGFFKVISDARTGKVVGAHLFGANATEIIGEAAAFIRMGASIDDIANTVHAHPTISEAFQEAALDAVGKCIHMPPKRAN